MWSYKAVIYAVVRARLLVTIQVSLMSYVRQAGCRAIIDSGQLCIDW